MEANFEQLQQQVVSEREGCVFGFGVFFFSERLPRNLGQTTGVLAVSSLTVHLHPSISLTVASHFVLD